MKKLLVLLTALTLALGILPAGAYAAEEDIVTIDMSTTYQTIDGFGASYTWYAEWLVNNVDAETGFDWIFCDAEFNILRFRDLNRVGDEHEQAELGYPTYYAYYSAAIERGIDPIVLVTSWGQYDRDLEWIEFVEDPDGWSYYTLAKDENGEYMYDALAEFCVQSIQYFYDAGIDVDYFSITNEAELQERTEDENGNARDVAGFFLGQEETEYHCAYWKAHIAVYDAFREAFGEYAPILLGAETMAAYTPLLEGYLTPVIENCPESLEIIGHHLYGTERTVSNFSAIGAAFSDYTIWQTEWYTSDYFECAEVIIDELMNENISAYLFWNGVWAPDAGICLIEVSSWSETAEISRLGNHYIMMHFSKFIKNGYQRVDVSEELDTKIAAFKSPDESKLIIVAMNSTEEEEYMTLDLGGKEILSSQVWISTEASNRFMNKYMQDGGEYEDKLLIPARSLMTIEIDLEGNPDYVEPVTEARMNPYVKVISNGVDTTTIVVSAVCAVMVISVIAVAAVTIVKRRKRSE